MLGDFELRFPQHWGLGGADFDSRRRSNVCKFLAEQYPVAFVGWLLADESGDPDTVPILKTELSQEPIRAAAVTFLQTANKILHLEFQTLPESSPPLPFRILNDSVRLKRQFLIRAGGLMTSIPAIGAELGKN